MYYVYILKSLKDNRYYIGYTANLGQRLNEHNRGKTKSLKNRLPLELVYTESYKSKTEGIKREKQIKKYKGGQAFKQLIRRDTRVV